MTCKIYVFINKLNLNLKYDNNIRKTYNFRYDKDKRATEKETGSTMEWLRNSCYQRYGFGIREFATGVAKETNT